MAAFRQSEFLYKCRNIFFFCAQFRKVDWHSKFMQEEPESADSFQYSCFRVCKIHLAAPNTGCPLTETHYIMLVNEFHPCRHNHRKTCTMCAIIKTAELMFNSMTIPVLTAADADNIVVGNHSGPHNICSGFVESWHLKLLRKAGLLFRRFWYL